MKDHKHLRAVAEFVKTFDPSEYGFESAWKEFRIHAQSVREFHDLEAGVDLLTGTRPAKFDSPVLHRNEWAWDSWTVVLTLLVGAPEGLEATA